ncbi:MAG TPA: hypothetical protein EYP78_03565 [Candidatus Omnitrophica bacterium]|nr:hypothetical protein [Candidatus Omnitrophota bacterium]
MLRLLSHPNPPTAVFISSGHCIIGAMSAIGEKGLKIPDNISLVGYDDIPLASYISPPLTTVRQPIYKLGKRGAEELFNLINVGGHKENKIEIILNRQLIIRQSVKPFR